jgi:hypothetical protein
MTSHSASVRFCALIDADMWRVRRTSRLMRFLSLSIGQTCVKVLDSREKAGGRYAAGLFLQLPARTPVPSHRHQTAAAWLTKR